jgi:putative spermidine/putrescine transport system ATP-binding protein
MKYWIKDLQKKLGITTVYVTHDQDEALTMSDRIGVMQKAKVEQVGTPEEIYERPKTLFVTSFIGQSNVIDATVLGRDGQRLSVSFGGATALTRLPPENFAEGKAVKLVVRPENIIIGKAGTGLAATVISETYQGALVRYHLSVGGQNVVAEQQNQSHIERLSPGQVIGVTWDPERSEVLVA